jgi:hypothetical protein
MNRGRVLVKTNPEQLADRIEAKKETKAYHQLLLVPLLLCLDALSSLVSPTPKGGNGRFGHFMGFWPGTS